jgi:hypothetical protein
LKVRPRLLEQDSCFLEEVPSCFLQPPSDWSKDPIDARAESRPMLENKMKKAVGFFAFFSLLAALITGFVLEDRDVLSKMQRINQPGSSLEIISGQDLIRIGKVSDEETGRITGYIALTETIGWGGPLLAATITDSAGVIDRVVIIEHRETHSYFRKLQNRNFFRQFSGKRVSEPLDTDSDIDAVSGATVSSLAFTDAVREGSHKLGTEVLNLDIIERERRFKIGLKEIVLLCLYVLVLVAMAKRKRLLRYAILTASLVFLGIYANASISIAGLSSVVLGYFPSIETNLLWWILIPGILFIALSTGKNIYCHWLCPFGAAQEFISKISGIEISINRKSVQLVGYIRFFLAWLSLMIIFLTLNPSLGAYEPFATLFGLEGIGLQWFILSAVLLGAFLIPLFWCRFFCPVKVVLQITTTFHDRVKGIFRKQHHEE